jgi:hypothetical protein
MTGIPLRKIYIDSRYKTNDSSSAADFRFQLNKNTFMPAGSEFCIDEINIPYAWNTIEANINDTLYMVWNPSAVSGPPTYSSIRITPKRYNGTDLAAELTAKLNVITNGWTVTYNASANTLNFDSSQIVFFKLLSDAELGKLPSTAFPAMNPYDFKSCNDIIQIFPNTASGRTGVPITSGFLNLLNYQDLYLSSATLGNFDVMGVRGETNVIRKVCVDSSWGYSIVDKNTHDEDWMSCSKLALSTLDFQLRDVRGNIVPLHGAHLSFTIRFRAGEK